MPMMLDRDQRGGADAAPPLDESAGREVDRQAAHGVLLEVAGVLELVLLVEGEQLALVLAALGSEREVLRVVGAAEVEPALRVGVELEVEEGRQQAARPDQGRARVLLDVKG